MGQILEPAYPKLLDAQLRDIYVHSVEPNCYIMTMKEKRSEKNSVINKSETCFIWWKKTQDVLTLHTRCYVISGVL